jgi:hypothetical protein
VHYDGKADVERRLLSVDFPPLAFVLLVEGPPSDVIGVDISHFTEWPPDEKGSTELKALPLGFGNKLWPGEYRSKGQMRVDGTDPD